MGFHPNLMKVSPEVSTFAPATYGDQLPTGLALVPQTQASSVPTPGGLM